MNLHFHHSRFVCLLRCASSNRSLRSHFELVFFFSLSILFRSVVRMPKRIPRRQLFYAFAFLSVVNFLLLSIKCENLSRENSNNSRKPFGQSVDAQSSAICCFCQYEFSQTKSNKRVGQQTNVISIDFATCASVFYLFLLLLHFQTVN